MPRYHLLLPAALLLWLAAVLGHRATALRSDPHKVAALIAGDLKARQQSADGIGAHRQDVLEWLSRSGTPAATGWLAAQPWYLFGWQGDSLVAWSTSDVAPPAPVAGPGRLLSLRAGLYYGRDVHPGWTPAGIRFSLLMPVVMQYPFRNEYLQPRFAAGTRIDPRTTVSETPDADAAPLPAPDGRTIGYVHNGHGDILPALPPAWWIAALWAAALVLLCGWAHLMARHVAVRRPLAGVALVVLAIALLRGAMYRFGLPFGLDNSALFSPQIYASSTLLPSLGDLLLNTLAAVWTGGFFLRYGCALRGVERLPAAVRWAGAVLCGVLPGCVAATYLRLIRSLIVDSLIPFDNTHLSSLDGIAITGLLITGLLTALLLLSAAIGRRMAALLLAPLSARVIAIATGLLLTVALYYSDAGSLLLPALACGWVLVVITAQSRERWRERGGGFRTANFFWALAHTALVTALLVHFIGVRESAMRRTFAEHIATRHDDALEYAYGQIAPRIQGDTGLLRFMTHPPAPAARKALAERLSAVYFNNSFPAYQAQVYLYDAAGRPLLNPDTTQFAAFSAIAGDAVPSRTAYNLYYREAATNDHIYLGILPVTDSSAEDERPAGSIVIDLEQKKIVAETVLPELLQPATVNQADKSSGYSYAVYADRKLVAQTSDYPFSFYIPADTIGKEYHERRGKDFTMLIYTPDARRTVYVWHRLGSLSEALTIFSYLLALRFLLIGAISLAALLRRMLGKRSRQQIMAGMGLRRRVQLSVTGIVLFSFLVIGALTVSFLRRQYANNSKAGRQAMMQSVSRAIQQWLREHGGTAGGGAWSAQTGTLEFRTFLAALAASQKIDINLFDAGGHLAVATQQAIYDNGLLAPLMRPGVLQEMYTAPRPLLMAEEAIGTLHYISCYTPLRDEGAGIAGFLNVPLFYSQRELDEQISGVVVALVNLYVATFLISSLLALAISGWITRAFDIIIRQFGRISLRGNEPLHWPYDDEIGLLVTEYNKMVQKVEESAALLARNEREEAWREMARQVAHEIKNPLTPMKLNIQYLQRALSEGRPDAAQMAGRVSESLLEQIDNLSTIATEFGHFAGLGQGQPAAIDLADVLRNVAELYTHDDAVAEVHYDIPAEAVVVMADRSQIVRIVTNLMQNALQAIPEGRRGAIEVRLQTMAADALIEVADNGSGISPEAQARLFMPYFTTKNSGTGLGLAMTRKMVEGWGGNIGYRTTPGAGTTFSILLPLAMKNAGEPATAGGDGQ